MKKTIIIAIAISVVTVFLFGTCSSNPRVTRVDPDTQIDLSGYWNDTDVRLVCDSLINDALNSPRVADYIHQYTARTGRLPSVLVGTFRNESSEHIDTGIISTIMESTILNTGRLVFVSGGNVREEVRSEREDQQIHASAETTAAMYSETGATFLMTGAVRSMVDRATNISVRSYFVNAQLTNIETNQIMWSGLNDEIKKEIRQPRFRR